MTAPPSLNHEELKWFYEEDMMVERDLLEAVMVLPKDSLVDDLILILEDSVKRFDYFEDRMMQGTLEYARQEFFPHHAFKFLSRLAPESKKAIPVILDVLRQGDTFLEFWFEDDFLEDGVNWLYPIFQDELEILSAFIQEEHLSQWVRGIVVELLIQVALNEPDRKPEVINWTLNQIDFFESKVDDRTVYSPLTMSKLLETLLMLRAKEHIEKIRDIYQKEIIEFRYSDTIEYVEETIDLAPDPRDRRSFPKDIFDFYDGDYREQTDSFDLSDPDGGLLEMFEDPVELYFMSIMSDQLGFFGDYDHEEDDIYDYDKEDIPPTTVVRTSPKVGRNDPCPCGSGKKYKKCCLNKG